MALDLATLTAYIDEQSFPAVTKALIGGRTASLLTPQLGVKGKTKINLMDVDVTMQDGSGCTFDASGDNDITFTQREIDAKQVKINMEFCPKDLNAYYWRTQMPAGTHQESLPFEEQFVNYLVEKVQDEIEKVIWGGNHGASGNLGMFDGLLIPTALFTDCNGTSGSFGTALTGSLNIQNVLEAVERIYVESPSAAVAKDDFRMYMGVDKFRTLAAAIMNGNGGASLLGATVGTTGSIDGASVDPLRIIMPGTNIEIVGVGGLEGFNAVYGFSSANAFLGMDLEADSSSVEAWYSQDDRKYRVAMEFTMGTQFAYPDQVGKVAI